MAILVRNKLMVLPPSTYIPLAGGEYSEPIPWRVENITSPSSTSGNKTDSVTGESMRIWNLADISTINNVEGAPTGIPANVGWGWEEWGNFNLWDKGNGANWYNYKFYRVIIDLEDIYDLDYIYIWNGSRDLKAMMWSATENEPSEYRPMMDNANVSNDWPDGYIGVGSAGSWVKYTFNKNQSGCKHFVIGFDYPDAFIRSMVLYGRKRRVNKKEGLKSRSLVRHRPANYRFGTNAFYFEEAEILASVSELTRIYVEPGWYMGPNLEKAGDGVRNNITPDDITLEFETNHMGNTDQLLQAYKNTGMKVLWACVANPVYLREWWQNKIGLQCPVDPGLDPLNLSVTTDPMNYKHISRIFYILAARYGSNPIADTSMINWGTGEVERKGMGLVFAIEIGNEYDRGWDGEEGYVSPHEMAAFMSACYDGHKGAMGAGFGIKNADPSLYVVLPGLMGGGDYLLEVFKWWDTHRGKGDYPMDVINYHGYTTNAGSQVVEVEVETRYGLPPETSYPGQRDWVKIRDKLIPGSELWNTETGYAEHWGGGLAPNSSDQFTRSRFKAYWLARIMLVHFASGIDVVQQYWFANVGMGRFEDLDQSQPNPALFQSNQLVDGNTDGSAFWGRVPMMSYWYFYQLKEALTDYYAQHIMVRWGERRTKEVVINSTDDRIWATSFKRYSDNSSIIAIWLVDQVTGLVLDDKPLAEVGYKTLNVTINIPESSVVVGKLDEAEIREGSELATEIKSSIVVGGTRQITVTIGECPIFIYTSNIGTPAPEPAEVVRWERMASGEMFISWFDQSTFNSIATIKRSTTENGTYNTIFTGTTKKPEYVDATATPGVDYYYKVELS